MAERQELNYAFRPNKQYMHYASKIPNKTKSSKHFVEKWALAKSLTFVNKWHITCARTKLISEGDRRVQVGLEDMSLLNFQIGMVNVDELNLPSFQNFESLNLDRCGFKGIIPYEIASQGVNHPGIALDNIICMHIKEYCSQSYPYIRHPAGPQPRNVYPHGFLFGSSRPASQGVTHPGIALVQARLTSEFSWDAKPVSLPKGLVLVSEYTQPRKLSRPPQGRIDIVPSGRLHSAPTEQPFPSGFCSWELMTSFPGGHPSWDCSGPLLA
ncbi:hypothetical protein LguiB_012817 [Lonicera macranthoides]